MRELTGRREFLCHTLQAGLGFQVLSHGPAESPRQVDEAARAVDPGRIDFLLITADDMNWDAPGCFGGQPADITPHIDRLAGEGMRFLRAHVTIAVCMPSRETLMTGRYPHRHGGEGFEPINPDVPTLQEQLHAAGYLNGILGKVAHLAPAEKYRWDLSAGFLALGLGRDPQLYYQHSRDFITRAAAENRPFFLMANSHDPHRPFHGSPDEQRNPQFRGRLDQIPAPSRVYRADEMEVPGFLPDLPPVREELAQYCSSARRCDDTVGAVLRALRESGQEGNTLVMFLSDNGMAFPFSKTNCYLHSTRTPWIVRWPGRVEPASVEGEHFISGIDYMSTVLDAAGLPQPDGIDGFSFLPLLWGERQSGRDLVFTEFHETSAHRRYPMRCVQDRRFGYIANFWADGKTVFLNEAQSGLTFPAMRAAVKEDADIAARVGFFQYRIPEEFYDFERDPDALHNLIDDPDYGLEVDRMRRLLVERMEKTGDPAAKALRHRDSPEAWARFMAEQNEKAQRRRDGAADE